MLYLDPRRLQLCQAAKLPKRHVVEALTGQLANLLKGHVFDGDELGGGMSRAWNDQFRLKSGYWPSAAMKYLKSLVRKYVPFDRYLK